MVGATTESDLIIVGNGVLALSTAVCLASENKDVRISLIGPRTKPGCASIAAGAMLASFAEVEKGTLKNPVSRAKFDLGRKACELWPAWAEKISRLSGKKLAISFGTVVINNTKADELDDESYGAIVEALEEYKERYSEIDPQGIRGYAPPPDGRAQRALLIPGEGAVQSGALAVALERALAEMPGVRLYDDQAQAIHPLDKGGHEVSTEAGIRFKAPQVLLACGSKGQELLDKIPALKGRIPRMVHGIGTGLHLKTEGHVPEMVIRTANRGLACGVHIVPYDREHCYLGASNFITPFAEYHPRMTSLYALIQSAMEQVHSRFYKAQVIRTMVGFRPTTVDTYPLLGRTSIPGFWILSGTKRDGIHMSPLYCQSIASEIAGKEGLFQNIFPAERKPIHTLTREEGIEKAVKHLKSAAYQHELRLPKAGWEEMVTEMLRRRVEKIYDEQGIKDFGIPPELLDIYRYGHVEVRK